jgi:hypothetical protein
LVAFVGRVRWSRSLTASVAARDLTRANPETPSRATGRAASRPAPPITVVPTWARLHHSPRTFAARDLTRANP